MIELINDGMRGWLPRREKESKMKCQICLKNCFKEEDVESILEKGYCVACQGITDFFTDDESISEEEANVEGLRIVGRDYLL